MGTPVLQLVDVWPVENRLELRSLFRANFLHFLEGRCRGTGGTKESQEHFSENDQCFRHCKHSFRVTAILFFGNLYLFYVS